MDKLELKHLAPYLPYELTGICTEEFTGVELVLGISQYKNSKQYYLITSFDDLDIEMFKPILRPLSDLTDRINPIQHHTYLDGLNYPNIDSVENALIKGNLFIEDYQYLIENHFDLFGLIEKELAIDINTLK